jgi:hypothetical protein
MDSFGIEGTWICTPQVREIIRRRVQLVTSSATVIPSFGYRAAIR